MWKRRNQEGEKTDQRAVARKERVEPLYMGELVTLKGNDSTLCCREEKNQH